MFWYRVIADGPAIDECEPQICCKKTIVNIHARTVAELCEKLSERKFDLPIQSVSKFQKPATLGNVLSDWEDQEALADEYTADSDDCLDDVQICGIRYKPGDNGEFDLHIIGIGKIEPGQHTDD